jgi:cob(I)alamin adenosyltransferase
VCFNVGSDLATMPQDRWDGMPLVTPEDVDAVERGIDAAQANLEPLATASPRRRRLRRVSTVRIID